MKKFFAFMLVLAMIASMMCINVAAETGSEHVVGNRGNTGSIADGETNWTSETSDAAIIQASINGVVYARYAVDLVFTIDSIVINNTAEWDVNQLKYVGDLTYTLNKDTDNETTGTFFNNTPVTVARFNVINYSNASVYVLANVTQNADVDIRTNVCKSTIDYGRSETYIGTNDSEKTHAADPIAAVETAYGANETGAAVPAYYIAEIVSPNWIDELWDVTGNERNVYTIATITFTVAPYEVAGEPDQRPVQGN